MNPYRTKTLPTEIAAQPITGESLTVPGEATPIEQLIALHAQGFPLPLARQEIDLGDGLNDLLEDQYDLPTPEEYQRLDLVERQQVRENLRQLGSTLTASIEKRRKELEAISAPQSANQVEGGPLPPLDENFV